MNRSLLIAVAAWSCASLVVAAGVPAPQMNLPADVRAWYRNPDGSCVQCSIGMCGADQNVAAAAALLFDTEYGPAVRGGSDPARVARYCDARGIRAYNVTGSQTFEWMKWAARNGRGCAIGAGRRHFQTLYGYDPDRERWFVCNNNSTSRIDEYDERSFHNLHLASGPWVVVLDYPPHPATPRIEKWW